MKKSISVILTFSILLSCGCSSIQVSGQPFGPKTGNCFDDLTHYLQKGVGILTKKEIKAAIPGEPEITIKDGAETWFFQNASKASKLKIGFMQTTRANDFLIEELTLFFNKDGVLTSYLIKKRSGKDTEKTSHMYKLGDGLFVGIISAIVFGIINNILGRLKK